MNDIKLPVNDRLGNNELRTYLENKNESSRTLKCVKPELLVDYRHPEDDPSVLLIFPPVTIPKHMAKRCIPPLGISYMASSLEKQGIPVDVIDCCVEGYDNEIESKDGYFITYGLSPAQLAEKLEDRWRSSNYRDPTVVGISVLFSNELISAVAAAEAVKTVFEDAVVVIGGLHPTIYPNDVWELDGTSSVDWVLRGEGEHRLVNFVELLKEGKLDFNMDGLHGFYGSLVDNHQVERVTDLDAIPFPAFDKLPMERYFEINVPFSPVPQGDRVVPILTSRGCPIGCSFCANTNTWTKYHPRSIESVEAEIRHWINEYGVDEVQFADDNLALDREHFKELLAALKRIGIKWCTPNGMMINTLTAELIQEMAESGLYQVTLSIDSADVDTLKNRHHKPVDLKRVPSLIEMAERYGVFTHGTLVVGMPGETLESVKGSLDYVLEHFYFTSISTFTAAPIPGSELYHQAIEQGLIKDKKDAWLVDTTRSSLNTDLDPDKLQELVVGFQDEFTRRARERNPEAYDKKYKKLQDRGLMPDSAKHGGRLT